MSKQRIRDFGEVFTPKHLVADMLDLIPSDAQTIRSRYLEPACGDGNFLIEILGRKLCSAWAESEGNAEPYDWLSLVSLSSIYGVELLQDNRDLCHWRLLKYAIDCRVERLKIMPTMEWVCAADRILELNIICGNFLLRNDHHGNPIMIYWWTEGLKNQFFCDHVDLDRFFGNIDWNGASSKRQKEVSR